MRHLKSIPARILIAVFAGIMLGHFFPGGDLKQLSEVGKLVIHWVKIVAGPFLFFTILHSIIEVQIRWRHGAKLLSIAIGNTLVAIAIGVFLAHEVLFSIDRTTLPGGFQTKPATLPTLEFSAWIKTMMPKSVFEPFVANEILLIATLALLIGLATRKSLALVDVNRDQVLRAVEFLRNIAAVLLGWLIAIIPVAVFFVIAGSVSEYGLNVFSSLAKYVGTVWLGFFLQVGLVYGFWIFIVAKISPKKFWSSAREPVLYALGVNSSLATLPLTLRALDKLGISQRSSSLGAGVATNINNDGIILYEAMAVFFIAHLYGVDMDYGTMLMAAGACIVAALGITGIPEAGFVSLSVVVATMGLPAEILPVLLAVDWIIARGRSAVNVLSDMTLSIALDSVEPGKN